MNASFEGADSVVSAGTGSTDAAARLAQVNASFEGADSVVSAGSAGRQTDAFMTADEMGNDATASGTSHPSLSAAERLTGETLPSDAIDTAHANPEGYTKPDLDF